MRLFHWRQEAQTENNTVFLGTNGHQQSDLAVHSHGTQKLYYLGDLFSCAKVESSIIIQFLRQLLWDDKEELLKLKFSWTWWYQSVIMLVGMLEYEFKAKKEYIASSKLAWAT